MANAAPKVAPPFLRKLYAMVDDQTSDDLIYWSPDSDSFLVSDRDRFAQESLDKWFKHKNYSSFVRQLNNYGFRKIPHLQQGALRSDTANEFDRWKHSSTLFRRGRQDLLSHIQRPKDQKAPDGGPPARSPEVCNSSLPLSTPEIVSASDTPQDQLLKTILLEVDSLKHRQMELETFNRCLRDEVGTMRRQIEFLLRLLVSLGLISMAKPQGTTSGNETLMIQGTHGNVDVGKGTAFDQLTDSPSSHYTVSTPPSSPLSVFSGVINQAHSSNRSSPISTERAPSTSHSDSPPPTSPSTLAGDFYQPVCHHQFVSGNHDASLFDSSTLGYSNQAYNFSGDLTGSLSCSEPHSLETHPNYYDVDSPNLVNPPVESLRDCIPSSGMGENDIGRFYHGLSSSLAGSAGGVIGSDVHTTSHVPAETTASVIGVKRRAWVMDGFERIGPECAAHTSPLSLAPYDPPSCRPAEFIFPELLLPLNDQHLAPRNHLMPDPTFPFLGLENDTRSLKRTKCTPENC